VSASFDVSVAVDNVLTIIVCVRLRALAWDIVDLSDEDFIERESKLESQ